MKDVAIVVLSFRREGASPIRDQASVLELRNALFCWIVGISTVHPDLVVICRCVNVVVHIKNIWQARIIRVDFRLKRDLAIGASQRLSMKLPRIALGPKL